MVYMPWQSTLGRGQLRGRLWNIQSGERLLKPLAMYSMTDGRLCPRGAGPPKRKNKGFMMGYWQTLLTSCMIEIQSPIFVDIMKRMKPCSFFGKWATL